jgi:hypothetical protein
MTCGFCEEAFSSEAAKDRHHELYQSGCGEHRICFTLGGNEEHARKWEHSICFVPGCESPFKKALGWSDKEIYIHIISDHGKN